MKAEATARALEQIRASGKVEIRDLGADERKAWRSRMVPQAEAAYVQRAGAEGRKAIELYQSEYKRLGLAG
jgi:hypothetical protein